MATASNVPARAALPRTVKAFETTRKAVKSEKKRSGTLYGLLRNFNRIASENEKPTDKKTSEANANSVYMH